MNLLVTGGAGYIGSHTTLQLLEAGHRVVVLDNLYSGFAWAVPRAAEFVVGEVGDRELLRRIFASQPIDAILHFAAHVEVAESVEKPLKYYQNNVAVSLTLIEEAVRAKVLRFIFSSTAAVYGQVLGDKPVSEDAPLEPMNPYGVSKMTFERILRDTVASERDFRAVIFRYFNAAGARADLRVGQATPRATSLIKAACEVATGKRKTLMIYGDDYATPDGTCLRDYVHVDDIARAHIQALDYLQTGAARGTAEIFNIGNSQLQSVLEVVRNIEAVCGHPIAKEVGPRRPGDPSSLSASNEKIRRVLGWRARHEDLETICRTAFEFEKALPQKLKEQRES